MTLVLHSAAACILRQARSHQLDVPWEKFQHTVRPPKNLQGLLFAAQRLRNILRHKDLPPHWQTIQPFQSWADLFDLLLSNALEIEQFGGMQIGDGYSRPAEHRSIIQGQMEDYPLFAMICTVHEDDSLDLLYGALQLQVLHAHWEKIREFQSVTQHAGTIAESRKVKGGAAHKNDIKLALNAARAVRKFQPNNLKDWLQNHNPLALPKDFRTDLESVIPPDPETRKVHTILRRYCAPGFVPRSGGHGGERFSSAPRYLFMLDYRGQRFSLLDTTPGNGDDGEHNPVHTREYVARSRVRGEKGNILSKKEIVGLGLDPLELSDSEIDLLLSLQEGSNRQQGIEAAHAQSRAFEIDRQLFPWNSQAIRLKEFHQEILPLLEAARRNPPVSAVDRAAAAAIAISAETGRTVEQLRWLRIEQNPSSPFAYSRPVGGNRCGTWKWDTVSPRYKGDLTGNEKDLENVRKLAVDRAGFLTYPASEMVTELIALRMQASPLRKGQFLFPYRRNDFASHLRHWLQIHGVDGRRMLRPISRLSWNLLHRNSGGELASVCLTLGLAHPLAQVELFYAVLHEEEAQGLFELSKAMLWKPLANTPPLQCIPDPKTGKFTGCRAFPRLEVVRKTIEHLRKCSEEFFTTLIADFRLPAHRDLLNGAVIYGLWHQFFCFGTRAICDAYQQLDGFSKRDGLGVLSDKDFSSGYKTRIVVANDCLRAHMKKLEKRLMQCRKQLSKLDAPDPGKVWLVDSQNALVTPRPSVIQEILTQEPYSFPFPVNTPRRVMRYLLRKSGMSHENAEAYMGHWWHGREPFSPFSSFEFGAFVDDLRVRMAEILDKQLGIRAPF